jgi:hypothetical protein
VNAMSNIFDLIWKEDPLKTASDAIKESNFGPTGRDKETPINISLLFVAALFVAVTKSLYGQSGYTLAQHLVASILLVFISYIGIGLMLLAVGRPYVWVNNRLRCFIMCLIASLIASLLFFFLEETLTYLGIAIFNSFPISEDWKNTLPNLIPPLFFSVVGTCVIYLTKRMTNHISWHNFLVYGIFTWLFMYFTAFDREAFFQTVMKPLARVVVY